MYLLPLFGSFSLAWVGLVMLARLLLPEPTVVPRELVLPALVTAAIYILLRVGGWWLNASFYRAVDRLAESKRAALTLGAGRRLGVGLVVLTLLPLFVYLLVFTLYALVTMLVAGGLALAARGVSPLLVQRAVYVACGLLAAGAIVGLAAEAWRRMRTRAGTREHATVVRPDEHEKLWGIVNTVAAQVGTESAGTIVLVPGPKIYVRQEGGAMLKLFGGGERVLILGLPGTHGMSVHDLEALLAAEFARFGPRGAQAGVLMGLVAVALDAARRGKPKLPRRHLLNPGYWYFRFFEALLVQVTRGFGRAREAMADLEALRLYGSVFGHAVQRLAINDYIFTGVMGNRAGKTLIDSRVFADCRAFMQRAYDGADMKRVQRAVLAKDRKADRTNIHPPLRTRLRYAKQFPAKGAGGGDSVAVLFDDWARVNRTTARDLKPAFAQNT